MGKEKIEEFKNKSSEKEQALQNKITISNTEIEDLKKDIAQWEVKYENLRTQMNNDLTKKNAEIFQLQKVMNSNKSSRHQYEQEQKLASLISERSNQLNFIENL